MIADAKYIRQAAESRKEMELYAKLHIWVNHARAYDAEKA